MSIPSFFIASAIVFATLIAPKALAESLPSEFSYKHLTPQPSNHKAPVLFADLTCRQCLSVIFDLKNNKKINQQLNIIFVRALPPVDRIVNQMLWHLSNPARHGQLNGGCRINCGTLASVGTEPTEFDFIKDSINLQKRHEAIGINTYMLKYLFSDINQTPKVPSLYFNGKLTVIKSSDDVINKLGVFSGI
ncbi:hypothetical protein [Marinomonas sp. 2405UD68-3]|uniref:hypothetical protein n=1 Tax=Marinomonas sp. 2405UD68-3 TaxID=3391835 RepID=UPI0039C8DE54